MQYSSATPDKDRQLWQLAQKRASFKRHLFIYAIMNIFFWLIWYFKGSHNTPEGWPWPLWPMVGWGIGLFFHFLGAYVRDGNMVEREYEKLKNQNK